MKKALALVLCLLFVMGLFVIGCQKAEAPKEQPAPAAEQPTGGYGQPPAPAAEQPTGGYGQPPAPAAEQPTGGYGQQK